MEWYLPLKWSGHGDLDALSLVHFVRSEHPDNSRLADELLFCIEDRLSRVINLGDLSRSVDQEFVLKWRDCHSMAEDLRKELVNG